MRRILKGVLATVLVLGLLLSRMSCGGTIIVTSTADSGPGTLRQALLEAQSGDTITFDPVVFPPSVPAAIYLDSALPPITQGNLLIDASNTGVILDGSKISRAQRVHGLSISSNSNTVRGLQIIGFPEAGVGLSAGASYNVIGGDRRIGAGPLGQGNLISGNGDFGIGLWGEGTSHNTIRGNYIGINLEGTATWGHSRDGIHSNGANYNLVTGNVIGGSNEAGVYLCCVTDGGNVVTGNIIGTDEGGKNPLGNRLAGVLIDRTSHNVIGPGNIIAYNDGQGIWFWEDTAYNTVTQNSIHDNGERGIAMSTATVRPLIFEFNLQAGNLAGAACANCTVEIFSDSSDEGAIYEGQTEADSNGAFTFSKGVPFTYPHLTATATTPDGSTSEFSPPTSGTYKSLTLQQGNTLPKTLLQPKRSAELADNRIGGSFSGPWLPQNYANALITITGLGLKRVDMSFGEIEPPIDWSQSEFNIPPEFDSFIADLSDNGIAINYLLHFWDKAYVAEGGVLTTPRFKTEIQIQHFVDYVRFFVRHFKGRIQYYTIWSEPDNCIPPPIKCIEPLDYINLVKRVAPVIRQEDPEAKIVSAPNVLFFARDYLFTVLNSDVVPLFDVISWHPMYDAAPDVAFYGDYYYEYPSIIQEIKQTASAHGFQGEYWGTELTWRITGVSPPNPDQPWETHTHIQSSKYWARGIVTQLGMDVGVGLGGPGPDADLAYATVRNLNTIMAGAKPISLTVEIQSEATNIRSYSFSLSNRDKLVALWTDGVALDEDPGIEATVTLPDFSANKATAIDVLNGFKQELITGAEDGNLVIEKLLIKDYPIILRLSL